MYQPTPWAAAVLQDLAAIGIELEYPDQLRNLHKARPPAVVEVLLRHVHLIETEIEAYDFAIIIQKTEKPFDGRPLIDLFERIDSEFARSQLSAVFWVSKPKGTKEWLVRAIQEPRFGRGRDCLMPALALVAPAEEVLAVIEPLAEELPAGAVWAWAICGGERELAKMEAELAKYAHIKRLKFEDPWPSRFDRDEMRKAVSRIRTRLRKLERTPSPTSPTVARSQGDPDNALAPALGGARDADA